MRLSFLLLVALACIGCTCRKVEYLGISYTHTSWLTMQSFGELKVTIGTNGSANVMLKNYANDQVSAIREAKEFVQAVSELKP